MNNEIINIELYKAIIEFIQNPESSIYQYIKKIDVYESYEKLQFNKKINVSIALHAPTLNMMFVRMSLISIISFYEHFMRNSKLHKELLHTEEKYFFTSLSTLLKKYNTEDVPSSVNHNGLIKSI